MGDLLNFPGGNTDGAAVPPRFSQADQALWELLYEKVHTEEGRLPFLQQEIYERKIHAGRLTAAYALKPAMPYVASATSNHLSVVNGSIWNPPNADFVSHLPELPEAYYLVGKIDARREANGDLVSLIAPQCALDGSELDTEYAPDHYFPVLFSDLNPVLGVDPLPVQELDMLMAVGDPSGIVD